MSILVTGGNGFLGTSLIDKLAESGNQIFSVGRHEQKFDNKNIKYIKLDLTDRDSVMRVKSLLEDVDTIVHMAALVPKSKDEDVAAEMVRVNVNGTINLLEIFGDQLKNFVYASSAEVYGLPATTEPIKEDLVPAPLSNYGASKLAGEMFCNVYASRHNFNVSVLRFTVLYGPGDTIMRAVPNFIKKALSGQDLEVYGGEELRDYLHVDDAVEALSLAASTRVSGIFNIGTGKGTSIKATADCIVKAVNPNLKVQILPREKKAADIVLDIGKSRTKLGFTPRYTFPENIERQIEWHKNN